MELTLDQGKNTPSRRYIEDMEYREMNSDSQHHIDKMVITDKYIFLSIIQKRACQEVIVSRETNTVVYNSVYSYGPERHIRIPGMAETTFWPWVVRSRPQACVPSSRRCSCMVTHMWADGCTTMLTG